jgi:hypothetical protein
VRERYVDDGGVQHLQKGAEHDRESNDPGIYVTVGHYSLE